MKEFREGKVRSQNGVKKVGDIDKRPPTPAPIKTRNDILLEYTWMVLAHGFIMNFKSQWEYLDWLERIK